MRAWEPEPGELRGGGKAWEAFKIYRDLGPGRTLRAVAEALYGVRWEYGKRTVEKWSSKFDWVERVRAFDAWLELHDREAVEAHEKARAEDVARRREALREANLRNEERAAALETTLLERVAELMDLLPLVRQTTARTDEDGRAVSYLIEPATKNPVLDVMRLHRISTRGEPTKIAPTTPDGLGEYNGGRDSDEEAREKVAGIIMRIAPKILSEGTQRVEAVQQEPVDGG